MGAMARAFKGWALPSLEREGPDRSSKQSGPWKKERARTGGSRSFRFGDGRPRLGAIPRHVSLPDILSKPTSVPDDANLRLPRGLVQRPGALRCRLLVASNM